MGRFVYTCSQRLAISLHAIILYYYYILLLLWVLCRQSTEKSTVATQSLLILISPGVNYMNVINGCNNITIPSLSSLLTKSNEILIRISRAEDN